MNSLDLIALDVLLDFYAGNDQIARKMLERIKK